MSKIFKVGIIGCGGIANGKHLPAISKLDNVKITHFCDIIPERAEAAREKYGTDDAIVTTNYMDVVNAELDAIHVCTPNKSHCEISCAAMNAGKHVMCEKPMAKTAAEAKLMVDTAKKTGVILTIGYQSRFTPEAEYVKLHGLRHSYASAAVASGMSIKSLMSQLGHSEVKMTMNLYAHAMESSKKEDVQRINQIFRPDEEKKMA